MLSAEQLDTLRELIGVGIGQTAALLSDIANERVFLSVPHVQFITNRAELDEEKSRVLFAKGPLIKTTITFGQDIHGAAHLCFPFDVARDMVYLIMGSPAVERMQGGLNAIEEDAMREIGNILLNGVLGSLADLMHMRFQYAAPVVDTVSASDLFKFDPAENSAVLVLNSTLELRQKRIGGTILLVLQIESISKLRPRIDQVMEEMR